MEKVVHEMYIILDRIWYFASNKKYEEAYCRNELLALNYLLKIYGYAYYSNYKKLKEELNRNLCEEVIKCDFCKAKQDLKSMGLIYDINIVFDIEYNRNQLQDYVISTKEKINKCKIKSVESFTLPMESYNTLMK